MRDIIHHIPSYTTELDRDILEALTKEIVFNFRSIESALMTVGIDSRYYQHWISLAKHGDERARAIVVYLHTLLEDRKADIIKDVANSRDAKAKMQLVEYLDTKTPSPIDATDNTTLYIADDWERDV